MTGLTARPNRVLYTSRSGSISTRFSVISAVSLDTLSDRFTGDAHVVNVSPKPLFIISKSWTLCTDLTNLPELVFTSTVRIKPSLPGKTCVMMPSGHCRRGPMISLDEYHGSLPQSMSLRHTPPGWKVPEVLRTPDDPKLVDHRLPQVKSPTRIICSLNGCWLGPLA